MARPTTLGVVLAVSGTGYLAALGAIAASFYWITAGQAAFGGAGLGLAVVLTSVFTRLALTAVRRELAALHRPDRGRIAAMEREIFGGTLPHGEPPVSPPAATVPASRARTGASWSVTCTCGSRETGTAWSVTAAQATAELKAGSHNGKDCHWRAGWGTG